MVSKRDIAVFIDRDGTLNEEVGYLGSPARLSILPGAAKAIKLLNEQGLKAVLITNQAGIAKGYLSESLLQDIHHELKRLLAQQHAYLDAIYYCPHHPEGTITRYRQHCICRKPAPGLLEKAARELGLSLKKSYVIGDKISDVELAQRVGATAILVLTGFGDETLTKLRSQPSAMLPTFVAANLYEAVQWILTHQPAGSSTFNCGA